ncbi:hypothetical protein E8E13_008977 [Curvularia kusanoi]|uniref:Uncharacterized protein n=1 Tax=Curvularia kusanoi TaxID=90978 RepID=A0A9P4WBZ7_CURKU|nr:hypothetical protein E8E13_008977 [Curvularia kusanoi]
MSDNLRKGLGEQASEKLTPDSQKSTTDKIGENVSGAGDRIAGAVQPEGQKSTTQKVGDSVRGGSDNAQNQGEGVLKQAQDGLSNAASSVQNALGGGKQ